MFKACILLLLLGIQPVVADQNEEQLQSRIAGIQQKLKVLKGKLNSAYGKEKDLIQQLEHQDRVISSVAGQIAISNSQLKAIEFEISKISGEIDKNTKSIEVQKQQILKLLKLQVFLNHDKTLKMLLVNPGNQVDINTKHQLKYLQNRLYNLIREVASKIITLEQDKTEKQKLMLKESDKKHELEVHKSDLLVKRKERLSVLNELKIEISRHESESETLTKDQQRLQNLLDEIQVLLSDLPTNLGSGLPFSQMAGKLRKPVDGSYIHSFHSRKSEDTKWDGVVIKSEYGEKVRAVAYGRVAFADWLRGFGMLVIIDHHEGYMSLYGFNQSLNVEAGDWVEERQVIATIGNSGILETPALYFEIRKDAIPQNPKSWVK